MAFPTTVQLKQGMEKVETSSQKHKLGTRGVTSDGRVFYYAENSGTAIDHGGYLVDGIAAVAAHDMDLARRFEFKSIQWSKNLLLPW